MIRIAITVFFSPVFVVRAKCKELGLDDDESLAPVPKRRRAKGTGIVEEEKISTALHSSEGIPTSTIVTNQHETMTQEFRSPTTSGDRQSRESLRQFDKTRRSPSKTELKPLDEDKTDCKVASEQPSRSALSDREYIRANSLSKNLESRLEDYSDGLPENNCDSFLYRKATLSCRVSSERLSSLEEEKRSQGPVGGELPKNKTDFDVPPSPGHVEPLPHKLSRIHHLLQNGEQPSITKY